MVQCITNIREEILKMVTNESTLKILNQIIDYNNNNDNYKDGNTLSITKIGLTRKQFYTKLNELITRGIIKREKGKYGLACLLCCACGRQIIMSRMHSFFLNKNRKGKPKK